MKLIKKIDWLIIKAFIGPFILTYVVVDFILLMQMMLSYSDELIGKDVGAQVFGKMLFYFALSLTPMALPLGILLACLITFGNLGEHLELTAIKSAGISLIRVLVPIGAIALIVTIIAFWFNNTVVPYANLKAWSTLYNVRTTKASLDLKEGSFYNGIPNYSIKVSKKYPDGKTLNDIMIYNHSSHNGNREMILADSALMYTIKDGAYLILELFEGNSYTDYIEGEASNSYSKMIRNHYRQAKMVFNLSSFKATNVADSSFAYHPKMKNVSELGVLVDSAQHKRNNYLKDIPKDLAIHHTYFNREVDNDTTVRVGPKINVVITDSLMKAFEDKKFDAKKAKRVAERAAGQARNVFNFASGKKELMASTLKELNMIKIERIRKYTFSLACFIMFLIGAPLGAIIKKGGLGVPTLVAVFFFIIYYSLTMLGEKWSKANTVSVEVGMWLPDVMLALVGLFFFNKARNDSRMFDKEAYIHWFKRVKKYFKKKDTEKVMQ